MRAVITGGAGFLGSHFCDWLLERGWEVVCLDNFITGSPANIAEMTGHPRFTLRAADVTDPFEVRGQVDVVLHLASPASPRDYLNVPMMMAKVGAFGTYNALQLAREKGAEFLLASTSECYGEAAVCPQPESYWGNVNTISPRAGQRGEGSRGAATMGNVTMLTLDDERELLSRAIRSEAERARMLASGLAPRAFRAVAHQWVWRAIASLVGYGKPVDLVGVAEELRRLGAVVTGSELVAIYHAVDGHLLLNESDLQFLRALRVKMD